MKIEEAKFNENEVVYVISQFGHFIGEYGGETINDELILKYPVQIIVAPQETPDGKTMNMPIPVYMKMDYLIFKTSQYIIGKCPDDTRKMYYDVRAKESGLTISTDINDNLKLVDFKNEN